MTKSTIPAALSLGAKWLNFAAAGLLLVMVLLINTDIFCRYVFANPIRGVVELVALSIPATIFLSLPFIQYNGKLIRADVFAEKLARSMPSLSNALRFLFGCIAVFVVASICIAVFPELLHSLQFDIYRGTEGDFIVRVWPLQFIILTGSAALLLFEFLDLRSVSKSKDMFLWLLVTMSIIAASTLLVESRLMIGTLSIAFMFIFIYLGMPVAYALMTAAVLGIALIKSDGSIAVNALGLVSSGAVSSYVFAAVPLFVLLGVIVGAANIGRDALQSVHWAMGRMLGGLAISTVLANAVFAAITGISIASAAIFSRIAVPPLVEQGYQPRFAVGLVAGSSVLGMLIPPSLLLIIFGLIAEVSINALFTAAIVPGLLLTATFIGLVVVVSMVKPAFAVRQNFEPLSGRTVSARQAVNKIFPIVVLITVTLGGIYGGIFTPTEAGAVGCLAALVLSLALGRLKLNALAALFVDAAQSSASILILIIGASAFSIMLTLSGIPTTLGDIISAAGMGLVAYTFMYLFALVLLGTILDSTSILLIMVPLALPTIMALDGNLIWFGIVTVIGVEIGLLTPPLGLSVYTIKSSIDDKNITLTDIFAGSFPFVLIMLFVTTLLIIFPSISLFLSR
ncbi:MAG: TRAP transporter large permease subunit [Gammaproteobacteria bacterium]